MEHSRGQNGISTIEPAAGARRHLQRGSLPGTEPPEETPYPQPASPPEEPSLDASPSFDAPLAAQLIAAQPDHITLPELPSPPKRAKEPPPPTFKPRPSRTPIPSLLLTTAVIHQSGVQHLWHELSLIENERKKGKRNKRRKKSL